MAKSTVTFLAMNHPNLIVMCGAPGSGKTTLSHKLAEEYKAILCCYDEIPKANCIKKHMEIYNETCYKIANDLRKGNSVIFDAVNISFSSRKILLDIVKYVKCNKIIYVMTTPLEECLYRNENRKNRLPPMIVKDLYRLFTPPTLQEGWDDILLI